MKTIRNGIYSVEPRRWRNVLSVEVVSEVGIREEVLSIALKGVGGFSKETCFAFLSLKAERWFPGWE